MEKDVEEFRVLFENAPLPYQSLDENGNILLVNQIWADVLGYSKEEVVGKHFSDFLISDDVDKFESRFSQFKEVGEVHGREYRLRKKSSEVMTVLFDGRIEYDDQGEFVRTHCMFKDITGRKKMEKQPEETQKSYQELFEKSADALFVHHPETGEVLDVNQKACEMYGESKEGFKGEKIWEFSSGEHPYTQEEAVKKVRNARDGEVEPFEWRARKKSGELFWAEVNLKSIDLLGEERIIASVRDITERKKAEEKANEERFFLESIINTVPDPIFVKDEDYSFILVNDALCEFLGHPREELIGKTDYDFFPEEEADVFREKDEQVFEKGETVTNVERITDSSGLEHIISTKKSLFELSTPSQKILVGVIGDITKRKKAEEELRKSEREKSLILESTPSLIVYQNLDHEVIWANKRAGKSVNEKPSDLVGRKCYEIWHNREKVCENCPVERAWETGKVERDVLESPDGRFWLITGAATRNEEGDITGAVEITLNITERKEAEERMEFLNTLLRQDLGSKYQTVQGYLQLLEEADLSVEYEEYLRKAIKSGREADEILGLAKKLDEIEETEWAAEKDIVTVLKHVIEDISDLVEREGVEIEENYPEEISKVEGDYSLNTLFKQTLMTRIQVGECKRMRINASDREEDILLKIEDDGKQLPEDVKNLFSGDVYTGETSGVGGVRYHMLREIARHNNAKIEVKDSELGGARFDVHLQKA